MGLRQVKPINTYTEILYTDFHTLLDLLGDLNQCQYYSSIFCALITLSTSTQPSTMTRFMKRLRQRDNILPAVTTLVQYLPLPLRTRAQRGGLLSVLVPNMIFFR